jgi:type I restriction enzyme R subunit
MIGRGTRLCTDLFGPGDDKTEFKVFDFCQNLEFFSQTLPPSEGSGGVPLGERIFKTRLELLQAFDAAKIVGEERTAVAESLRAALESMNENNFLVRPHLELVERFRTTDAWANVTVGDLASLGDRVAKLPTELEPEPEDAKRFDVIMLGAELALVRGEPFERQRQIVMKVAAALEEQQAIPAIAQQLELIQDIQHDEWWIDVTYSMLEEIRKKLRLLVPLIERSKKNIVYTKFTDELGTGVEVELPGIGGANESTEFAQFRKKAQHFLRENLAETAVAKVRSGETLTNADIADLQRILVAAGIGDDSTFEQAAKKAGSFGKFIRGLVGLDRAAAKEAFAEYLDDKRYSKNQIQFVSLIIDELTERGVVDIARVYEAPYIALAPEGPETMFVETDLERIFELLERWANVESVS